MPLPAESPDARIDVFDCGPVRVEVVSDEKAMGRATADHVVQRLKGNSAAGVPTALWLMAAPSAFPFYEALIDTAKRDGPLREILTRAHFFQFDDYPVPRGSPKFRATFRHLLEERLYGPLAAVCGPLDLVHPLELTGTDADRKVQDDYRDTILQLREQGVYFLELKGTGMDGHWGFHGAETPLDSEPGMITVPMSSQNIRQQMLDWPELFPTPAEMIDTACTFNVRMFLTADEIVDNVPQARKAYSALATYGTDAVIDEIPSTAIKRHPRARGLLTQASAWALMEFRRARRADPQARLSGESLEKLRGLWRDGRAPEMGSKNTEAMERVLRKLGMI